jgi:hypothetical protein
MEWSDWSLSFAMFVSTLMVCVLGPLIAGRSTSLSAKIQFLSGFVSPPLVAWGVFSVWGSIRGFHSSGALLLSAWFISALVGMFISIVGKLIPRRTNAESKRKL